MNPARVFILRPVATSLAMIAIFLSGLIGWTLLPQAALPQVDYPTIQVVTFYPGASPEVMATSVTAPLERQFGAMAGLDQMSSTSSGGAAITNLRFNLDLSLDIAEQSVQAAINAAASFLPADLPAPPIYNKVNPADAPVLTLAVTSTGLPMTALQDLVDTRLAQRISEVSGVGLVSLSGGQRPAVRIQLNPTSAAAYGLGFDQVRAAISEANSNQAKGNFDGPDVTFALDANSQLRTAADYRQLVVASRNGVPVRLEEIARVIEGAEDTHLAAWSGDRSAILVSVQRQPGANVVKVVDGIRALLPQLLASLPSSVAVAELTDRTRSIRASVRDVEVDLCIAVGLVVLVIFLFLRSSSATLIPSLAVPLSLVGAFGAMYLAGFSVNNLTLMALTVGTGFVVDDAIVMIENIARHIEDGHAPLEAALRGAREISFTIISLTCSLIAVLIPLLFMGDVVGRLFREFAITLAVAILISAGVSLSFTPMLCARLLKPARPRKTGGPRATLLDRVVAGYGRLLRWILAHQRIGLALSGATLMCTLLLAWRIPKGFFPVQDTGTVQAVTEAPCSTSFAAMSERQRDLARIIVEDPAVESLSSIVGVDGVNTTLNSGRMLINLKPYPVRIESATAVIHRLLESVGHVAGIDVFMQPVQDLTVDEGFSRTQFQYTVESPDDAELARAVPPLLQKLQNLPQLADVTSDLKNDGLKAYVEVDRDTAGRLGVSIAAVDDALYSAFGQRFVSTVFTQTSQYRVVLEALQPSLRGPQALDAIYVSSSTGRQVPLTSIARILEARAPLALYREKQFPAATLSFNLAPGTSLGEAVDAIDTQTRALSLSSSLRTHYEGAALAFRSALSNELFLLVGALATMYVVLGVLYESFIHPLTILSTLPSAGVGALLALLVTHTELTVIAVIAIVLLIGIVQKNAIMIIDFALEAERVGGKAPAEAIYRACLLRFRPIMMTTMAALLSALPLALGSGPGSELRRPLGIAMVGGLLFSQVVTLFTTPVVYLAFDRLARSVSTSRSLGVFGKADSLAS